MKLKHITLQFTEDELITLHNALEDTVKSSIEESIKLTPIWDVVDDLKDEIELLKEIGRYFGYKCSVYFSNGRIKDWKSYDDVDEWVKALVKEAKSKHKIVE